MIIERQNTFMNSNQIDLGRLIQRFEALIPIIRNRYPVGDVPVLYEDKETYPTTIASWRGSYDEAAFNVASKSHNRVAPLTVERLSRIHI